MVAPGVVVHAVDDLVRLGELDRVAGHAGQVAGVVQALADDQQVRVDLVEQVPHSRCTWRRNRSSRAVPPRRAEGSAADGRMARLVLDVHRGDQRIRGVPLGDVLPDRGELRDRPAVVEPQAVGVVVGAAPAEIEQVDVGDDDQALVGQRLDARVVDLQGRRPLQVRGCGEGTRSATGVVCSVIHRLNGNRTQLNPCWAMSSASALRSVQSRPTGTPMSSLAPYQFTPARRTRLP